MREGPGSPFFGSGPFDPSSSEGEVATQTAEDPLLAALQESRRVLVTGATGFVGRHLLARLASQGHRVRALSRSVEESDLPVGRPVEWRRGDVTRGETLFGVASDCEVVVHLVGIARPRGKETFRAVHVEGTRNVIAEARRAEVGRFVFLSAVGARAGGPPFFETKHEAETEVASSGLQFVVFRPSVIYGPGDHFTSTLVRLLRRLPVFPVLGPGSLRLQPVSIEDVTDAIGQAVVRPDLANRYFELAGPERLKFSKIVRVVAGAVGVRRPLVPIPAWLSKPALGLVRRLDLPAPITPQQLELFHEASLLSRSDNVLRTVFRLEPLPFRVAVADYLE